MPYNKSLDKVLLELDPVPALADVEFRFRVVQYNGGAIKLSITKTFWHENSKTFRESTKLGRLDYDQLVLFQLRIDQAAGFIDIQNLET